MATTSSFSLLLDAERCELEAMLDSKIAGLGRGQKQDYVRRLALFGAAFENFDPDTFNMVTGLALKTTDPDAVAEKALSMFKPKRHGIHDYSQMD